MSIKHAETSHVPGIVRLNNQESDWVGDKDEDFFERYMRLPNFYVFQFGMGKPVGFVMAMNGDVDCDSNNFKWFQKNMAKDFLYVDRVVVHHNGRRKGIGSQLYDHLELSKPDKVPLVCEVSVDPLNEASVAFHRKQGFRPMGEYEVNGHRNSMLIRG